MVKPVLLVGEAYGTHEAKIGKGFVGASGIELLKMLHEAQVISLTRDDWSYFSRFWQRGDPNMIDCVWEMHPEIKRTNVFQRHPPGNRLEYFCGGKAEGILGYPPLLPSKYVRREFIPELERLGDEIMALDPNLIVCLGNTPLWALCGKTGITKVRGTTLLSTHVVSDFKLLAAFHPAAVLRQWQLRPTTIMDLMKINREKDFPEIRRPKRQIWIEPTLEDIKEFINTHIVGCDILSVDIETSGNQITCIGFAPNESLSIVIPFFDARKRDRSYFRSTKDEVQAWKLIRTVLQDPSIPKVFQNGLYDIAFLWRSYGIGVKGATHDTMLLHHALQPEALKGLGYLGSLYTDEGAWKQDRNVDTIKRDD